MTDTKNIETALLEMRNHAAFTTPGHGVNPSMLTSWANRIERALSAGGPDADPKLAAFYQVSTVAELLAAMEEHIVKLQDAARRNVKPWEDTFPPTLLPKYLRETGLAAHVTAAGAPAAQQPLDEPANNAGVATGSRNDSPSESVTRGSLPPLPDSFARVCNDGYWLIRVVGTERFSVHDLRSGSVAQEVYSADQLREYAHAAVLQAATLSGGVSRIAAERSRHFTVEGWTPEHDDEHDGGELADAAACYVLHASGMPFELYAAFWPWDQTWWKPSNPIRDLEKAGGLIAAEIDRLERGATRAEVANG